MLADQVLVDALSAEAQLQLGDDCFTEYGALASPPGGRNGWF